MLGIVPQELDSLVNGHKILTPTEESVLRCIITPTELHGSPELDCLVEPSKHSPDTKNYILIKPIRSGKSAGIDFGSDRHEIRGRLPFFLRFMPITLAEADMLPEGKPGHLVLISLQRMRNPLVRYVSGDVGSVHSLPDTTVAQLDPDCIIKEGNESNIGQHLKMLRLHGRDLKRSFSFVGYPLESTELSMIMDGLEGGKGSILQ